MIIMSLKLNSLVRKIGEMSETIFIAGISAVAAAIIIMAILMMNQTLGH
jgi:hypothetical protein